MKSYAILAAVFALMPTTWGQLIEPGAAASFAKDLEKAKGFIQLGNRESALPILERLVKIYDRDGDVRFQLGVALVGVRRYEDAIPHYEAALKLGAFSNKFEAGCHYDLACCYARLGKQDMALQELKLALGKGFRDIEHLRSDEDLASLHTHKEWEELAATKDTSKMSRDEAWRYDLWFLNRELRRIHLNPYRFYTPKQFDDFVSQSRKEIPKLTDSQIMVRLIRLMAMAGDGHTGMRPAQGTPALNTFPIQAFEFEEGWFITAAHPSVAELAGAQILAMDGVPIQEVFDRTNPYLSQDNPQNARATFAGRMMIGALMNGIGITKSATEATFSMKLISGETKSVKLQTGAEQPGADWVFGRKSDGVPLYLKNRTKAYYMEPLPNLNAMYVQYYAVRNEGSESLSAFAKRVFETMDKDNIQRLILDVRYNGGGNTFLSQPIHEGIMRRERLNQKGNLFVITGRNTFSAAQNFTTDIGRYSKPIYVGEPTGSSPNFTGESVRFTLPYSKATCSVSDLHWQRSWPMDHRIWIAPDLPAPPVFKLYFENRDPAMEAIEAYLKAGA